MILASDGLWEFVSSEEALRVAIRHWLDDNPQGACDELTQLAVQRWGQHDSSVDDITIVVVFLHRCKNIFL